MGELKATESDRNQTQGRYIAKIIHHMFSSKSWSVTEATRKWEVPLPLCAGTSPSGDPCSSLAHHHAIL